MNKRGDCYEAAGKYFMDYMNDPCPDNLVLVHAEVAGQSKLAGMTLGHAWVENLDTGFAIDPSNGRFIALPIPTYRMLAGVDIIRNEHRYTLDELRRNVLTAGHWGPWELNTNQ